MCEHIPVRLLQLSLHWYNRTSLRLRPLHLAADILDPHFVDRTHLSHAGLPPHTHCGDQMWSACVTLSHVAPPSLKNESLLQLKMTSPRLTSRVVSFTSCRAVTWEARCPVFHSYTCHALILTLNLWWRPSIFPMFFLELLSHLKYFILFIRKLCNRQLTQTGFHSAETDSLPHSLWIGKSTLQRQTDTCPPAAQVSVTYKGPLCSRCTAKQSCTLSNIFMDKGLVDLSSMGFQQCLLVGVMSYRH